nr:MAG TPA: hypothetical protein [Caudoviricetes sp.]
MKAQNSHFKRFSTALILSHYKRKKYAQNS